MKQYHDYCKHKYEAHPSEIRELVNCFQMNENLMEVILEEIFGMPCKTHLVVIRVKFDGAINWLEDVALAFAKHNCVVVLMPERDFILDLVKTKKFKCSHEDCSDALLYAVHRGQWIIHCLEGLRSQIHELVACKKLVNESTRLLRTFCQSLHRNIYQLIVSHVTKK